MKKNLEKKINFLMAYAIISTLFISFFALSSFSQKDKVQRLDELVVKKITVVGEDNSPRMVLSNETRQHSGRMNGKDWAKRERPAGIIFFNNQGDECGGIIFKATEKDGKIVSGMSFTMDQYKNDQVLQILNDEHYADGKTYIERGITINEYPEGADLDRKNQKLKELNKIKDDKERKEKINELMKKEGHVQRLFMGKTYGNSSGLFLAGADGKLKMMIYVDEKGVPKIQTLNEKGEVKDFIENK